MKTLGEIAPDPGPVKNPNNRAVGWHPHRGFDIISYIKEGRGNHADSLGNQEEVRPGGVQWLRAGSGIEHAEGKSHPDESNKHGFQLWIDLSSDMKMDKPQYGTVQPEDIPEIRSDTGGVLRILGGYGSNVFPERSDEFQISDCELPPHTTYEHVLPAALVDTILVYAYVTLLSRNVCT